MRTVDLRGCLLLAASLLAAVPAAGAPSELRPGAHHAGDALADGFRTPPKAAKPRVWWHWMNGNVTERGIRADLEWMNRIGIGGADAIDASIATPQVVPNRLVYMSPAWKRAFRYAAGFADKFGMELSINSSPGWSLTGGPWVLPQQGMKKLVWTSTAVDGGRPFHGRLPQPPDTIGPFQNAGMTGDIAPTPAAAALKFYRDSIVIAYRTPAREPSVVSASSSAGPLDAAALSDGDLTKSVEIAPSTDDADVWVRIGFDKPATIQGLTVALSVPRGIGYAATVEASDDGVSWRAVADVPKAAQLQRLVMIQQTVSFPPATGRFFRLVLRPGPPLPTSLRPRDPAPGLIDTAAKAAPPRRVYRLFECVFRATATVHAFEAKAQFATPPRDFYSLDGAPAFAQGTAVDPASVVVLTDRMKPDGTLDWNPLPGSWTVLRMGYSLTGSENHPATPEATGLEVDKLNRAHVRAYLEQYLDTYEHTLGRALFGRRGLQSLVVDSAETGMQNWTEAILADFQRLRGYDPAPWLPALTGAVVRTPADSDKFLWDFRRTIAELQAQNHYGEIAAVARARGLKSYAEAIEDHRPTFGDDMEMRRFADYPMAAMWTYGERWPAALTYEADILGAASLAHVYGQNLVAAESLTSAQRPWAFAPRDLKPLIDMEFVRGVNRVVIHTSVHQPVDRPPGLSLFGYGQFFNRLETWGEQAGAWMTYIARCSFMLQQGRYAADIAYFYGEEAPLTGVFGDKPVDVPPGYAFDFVGYDALLNQLEVSGDALATKSGMRYRVLYLGGSSAMMTLPVLRRIGVLVGQGAVLVGRRPVASPSLADDPAAFAALAEQIFGSGDVSHAYGKGTIYPSGALAQALDDQHLAPDFDYAKPQTDSKVLFAHRHLGDGELYFVSNRADRAETFSASFRTAKYDPEIWDPVTGGIAKTTFVRDGERTVVSLPLPAHGSAFVVFRETRAAAARGSARSAAPLALSGAWRVDFQPNRGAPPAVMLRALAPLNENADPGIRYFSGAAIYSKTFNLPALRPGERLTLDLGDVREVASVTLNGKPVGTAWTMPFQLDITSAARAGYNILRVKVANLWVNRLIGDAQPGVAKTYTFTVIPTYRADAPLRSSGLLGPVVIRRAVLH